MNGDTTTPLLSAFENVVKGVSPNLVSELFLYTILIAALGTCVLAFPRQIGRVVIPAAPAFLTSLGILGTFTGIFVGLAGFDFLDADAIDRSLPRLLAGLQMAFVTSIAGILSSIVFRVTIAPLARLFHERTSRRSDDPVDNLVAATEKQTTELQTMREQIDKIATEIVTTRSLISGDGDTSVISQIQKIRLETRELVQDVRNDLSGMHSSFGQFGENIQKEFREFAQKVSELSSKELIKALEEVIRDFNTKLTDQFGDNFKRLDASVAKLLEWQENYRIQLEALKGEFELARGGISDTQIALEAIRKDTEAIPHALQGLQSLFVRLDAQIGDLERHLDAFIVMRDRAGAAIPELKQHLEDVFEKVGQSVTESQSHFQQLQAATRLHLDSFSAETKATERRFTEMLNERIEAVGTRLEQTATHIEERQSATQGTLERSAEALEAGANKVSSTWQQLLANTHSTAERIGDELQKAMTDAGTNLKDELQQSFSEIRNAVATSVETLNTEAEQIAARYRKAGEIIETASTNVADRGRALTAEWAKVLTSAEASLTDYSQRLERELRKASGTLGQELESSLKQERVRLQDLANTLREEHRRSAAERTELLNSELHSLDDSMQKELTRALTQMGEQLSRITGKFVTDYDQLVARMDHVLRAGEQLERPS